VCAPTWNNNRETSLDIQSDDALHPLSPDEAHALDGHWTRNCDHTDRDRMPMKATA